MISTDDLTFLALFSWGLLSGIVDIWIGLSWIASMSLWPNPVYLVLPSIMISIGVLWLSSLAYILLVVIYQVLRDWIK